MSQSEDHLIERIERLEQQVMLLSEHLGLAYDDPDPDIPAEVVDLARAGRRVEAIKRYVELTGTDIGTATSIVNAII